MVTLGNQDQFLKTETNVKDLSDASSIVGVRVVNRQGSAKAKDLTSSEIEYKSVSAFTNKDARVPQFPQSEYNMTMKSEIGPNIIDDFSSNADFTGNLS